MLNTTTGDDYNTDGDGASGSMIWALANHHSSSQVDSAETAGRQNCTEPYRHRHSYTLHSHRHAETQTHRQRVVWGQRHTFIHRQTKPHRDTHTETQFTIHHWFDISVGHSHSVLKYVAFSYIFCELTHTSCKLSSYLSNIYTFCSIITKKDEISVMMHLRCFIAGKNRRDVRVFIV